MVTWTVTKLKRGPNVALLCRRGFSVIFKEHGPEKNVKMCAAYELKGIHREGFKKQLRLMLVMILSKYLN